MLNELFDLSLSLSQFKLEMLPSHPDLKKMKRQSGFIVGIDQDGLPASIEFCNRELMETLWKIEPHNHASFPSLNLTTPIWGFPSHVAAQLANKRSEHRSRLPAIQEAIQDHGKLTYSPNDRRLLTRIREFPAEIQRTVDFVAGDKKFAAFPELLRRLAKSQQTVEGFLQKLSDTEIRTAREGQVQIQWVEEMLIGKWSPKEKKFSEGTIPIVLDLSDCSRYQCRVADPEMRTIYFDLLSALPTGTIAPKGKGTIQIKGTCAFTAATSGLQAKFPSPILPVIGKTYLMSMNSDAPCQFRYGMTESGIFPVSKPVSDSLQTGLEFITSRDREGKTWKAIPSANKKESDLLIAYLAEKPQIAIGLASLFAEEISGGLDTPFFEETATSVCKALEGEVGISKDSLIRLLVLTKVDPGRAQALLSKNITVGGVLHAAREWQTAARNLPTISFASMARDTRKIVWLTPSCPSPASVMRCLRKTWIRGGTEKCDVPGCTLGEVYGLFLDLSYKREDSARGILPMLLERHTGLLLALKQGQHTSNSSKTFLENAGSADAVYSALAAVSLLGILLFKLGRFKENYMNEAAFNLGRLFSLVDDLHSLYCQEVRGSTTGQLLGNALMNTALSQPVTALALLSERMLPYQAWARTIDSGEKIGLAKWLLKEIGNTSSQIDLDSLPRLTTDSFKAEVILGYIRSNPKKTENMNLSNKDQEVSNGSSNGTAGFGSTNVQP
jgi:hypothetical protein